MRVPLRFATGLIAAPSAFALLALSCLATPAAAEEAEIAVTAPAEPGTALAPEEIAALRRELKALQSEAAAAKAAEEARADRIDALAARLAVISGEPVPATAPPPPTQIAITNPPRSGVVGLSTPGEGFWGTHDGAKGFTVARTDVGELNISGYILGRYINQMPDGQVWTDHLGREHVIDARDDIQLQRMMIWIRGWVFTPRLKFDATSWAVNSTEQATLVGSITYDFSKAVSVGVGINRNQGSQTMHFNHPYWFSSDRVMADEFFRPGFASSVWVAGEPTPGLRYIFNVASALSQLGVNATQFTRDKAYSGSIWWMPTTKEFGPKEGFGDFEHHQKLATLFSIAYAQSRTDRFSQPSADAPDNTQIRLSDSLLFFDRNALAEGVTVQKATYQLASLAANFKYRGFAFHSEGYWRRVSDFEANGPTPIDEMIDTGFYIQTGYMVVPKKAEIYASTSQIYGEFNDASEYILGGNWYPFQSRNARLNFQVMDVNRSAVSGLFGFYVGGQDGTTISAGMDVIY